MLSHSMLLSLDFFHDLILVWILSIIQYRIYNSLVWNRLFTLVSMLRAPGGWKRPMAVSLKLRTSTTTEFSSAMLSWNCWGVKCVPPISRGASKGLKPYVTICTVRTHVCVHVLVHCNQVYAYEELRRSCW